MGKIKLNGIDYGGGSGSGDTVEWTQIEQSGTKIAEIDINGTSQDVYAPSGGGGGGSDDYTTTEQVVGTWIDGKPLYQITIAVDNPTKQTSGGRYYYQGLYNSNVLDFAQVVSVAVYDSYYSRWYTLPYDRINGNESIDFFATTNATGFALSAHFAGSAPAYNITKLRYTIQYTKTTD